jgi:L-asparaginase
VPPHVALITTGGTISTLDSGAGAVPVLRGSDLIKRLGETTHLPAVEVTELAQLPGCEMTPAMMAELALTVRRAAAAQDCIGVVVTHGTDTIEESAFLCHLTIAPEKPVAFSGSMRTASDLSWDGPRNLLDALRVAAAPLSRGAGTLLVMNEEIHAARFVTKSDGTSLGAFQSPACGRLGRIDNGDPRWFTRLAQHPPILEPALEPAVLVVRAMSGETAGLISALSQPQLRGLVVDGFGGGRVPASWCAGLEQALQAGVAVVLTSRTGGGPIGDTYGYQGSATSLLRRGVIPVHHLPAHKARLALMLALGNRLAGEALRQYLELL